MTTRGEPTTERSTRVEDLIFLDDLCALQIPWVERLVSPCASHEDVQRVWTLIRMCGPDHEDAMDMLSLSLQVPELSQDVEKILCMIRLCENYHS